MKPIRFHRRVEKELESLDVFTRAQIMELLALVSKGKSLGLPASRPMSNVAQGAHELRVKSAAGQYRVFYFVKYLDAILVFHGFKKKTETTPRVEIETGRNRLRDML